MSVSKPWKGWKGMTARQAAEAVLSAPKIAGPWRNVRYPNGVETWERDLWEPKDGRKVPIQLKVVYQKWGCWFAGRLAEGKTPEEAKASADAVLRKDGYLLDDGEDPGPLRRHWEPHDEPHDELDEDMP